MRFANSRSRLIALFWRLVPISAFIAVCSYVLGSQIVTPHRRMIKIAVVFLMLVVVARFEMIYSLYLFVILFPVPSGISITSTNVLLMTLIFLLWVIRAQVAREPVLRKTDIDRYVLLFIAAYMLSFLNVSIPAHFAAGVMLFWRQLTALAFFYLIVKFVDSEKRLETMTKIIAISAGILVFTAVIELMAPGAVLIPGWIVLAERIGEGTLGYRLEGIRLGGAVGSHGLLADYSTTTLFFMGLYFLRSKNPITKGFWLMLGIVTFAVVMATANRGAFMSLTVGLIYSLWVFRRRLNIAQYALIISAFVLIFAGSQIVLDKYTVAASITERLLGTEMEGFVPETRKGVWDEPFRRSFDHIFIGHGPYYGVEPGLKKMFWPHNGYLFFLYSIGLLGLSAFLLIIFKLLRISLLYKKSAARDAFTGLVMSVLHIQLIIILLEQMRTDHQRNSDFVYMYIVWMFFGLIVATGNLIKKRQADLEAGEQAHPPPVLDHGVERES